MQNIASKTDNVSNLTAAEWNQVPDELENAITDTGQTLSAGDVFQISRSMANYAAGGASYTESGTANAYVLSPIGTKKGPTAYVDGLTVAFRAGNRNTGSSTINLNSLGVKNLNREDGTNLAAGDILANEYVVARYYSTGGYFVMVPQARIGYGVDTGSANAYAVALPVSRGALVTGESIRFRATNANTGASTLNLNSIGAVSIKRHDGRDVVNGDIPALSISTVIYDGTNWVLQQDSLYPIERWQIRGLKIKNNATNPNTQLDWSIEEAYIETKEVLARSGTLDVTISGPAANGRDAAATLTTSNWHDLWLIYNPTTNTVAMIVCQATATATPTAPAAMPTGYTKRTWVGQWYFNGSSQLINAWISGRRLYFSPSVAVTGGSAANYAAGILSIPSILPPAADRVTGTAQALSGATTSCIINVSGEVTGLGSIRLGMYYTSGGHEPSEEFNIPIYIAQTIYYYVLSCSATINISQVNFKEDY